MQKKEILFVGSFNEKIAKGGVGGQMYASRVIVHSELSNSINWTLIDSTADSNISLNLFNRISRAVNRVFRFTFFLLTRRFDYVLIFTGEGWSFWEKGFMSILAKKITRSSVIIAPRSGFIINDIDRRGLLFHFIKFVFERVDVVICQSMVWKEYFENIVSVNKRPVFKIIENLIDFDIYNKNNRLYVSERVTTVILFMAWVSREKGIFELIEAINLLRRDRNNFKLIIAGSGKDYDEVYRKIEEYSLMSYVELKGWVLGSSKMELLKCADIFVLPTYFDGYPNSLMEAMASGIACIATRVGSIPDMIIDNQNGMLIDREDSVQLYHKLKALIDNSFLRWELGMNARNRVRANNSVAVGISKYKEVFNIS